MGGAVSTGTDNDDLVDNLIRADYLKSNSVIEVFRLVDRADYFLPENRRQAYRDVAWRSGYLHLSAPCIYAEVMENLELRPGLSFLNIGSGTGYVSTMVGLLLGSSGVNHGVELRESNVEYAKERCQEFYKKAAFHEKDWCKPEFSVGNCLCLSQDSRTYDRIYCGAACPPDHLKFILNLLKVGGLAIMPIEEQLVVTRRIDPEDFQSHSILPVSFAELISPSPDEPWVSVELPELHPPSLKHLCREKIRSILRNELQQQHAEALKQRPRPPSTRRCRTIRRYRPTNRGTCLSVVPPPAFERNMRSTRQMYRREIHSLLFRQAVLNHVPHSDDDSDSEQDNPSAPRDVSQIDLIQSSSTSDSHSESSVIPHVGTEDETEAQSLLHVQHSTSSVVKHPDVEPENRCENPSSEHHEVACDPSAVGEEETEASPNTTEYITADEEMVMPSTNNDVNDEMCGSQNVCSGDGLEVKVSPLDKREVPVSSSEPPLPKAFKYECEEPDILRDLDVAEPSENGTSGQILSRLCASGSSATESDSKESTDDQPTCSNGYTCASETSGLGTTPEDDECSSDEGTSKEESLPRPNMLILMYNHVQLLPLPPQLRQYLMYNASPSDVDKREPTIVLKDSESSDSESTGEYE